MLTHPKQKRAHPPFPPTNKTPNATPKKPQVKTLPEHGSYTPFLLAVKLRQDSLVDAILKVIDWIIIIVCLNMYIYMCLYIYT